MIAVSTSIWIIVILALVTFATRLLPFVLWGNQQELSPLIRYLGEKLPYAMMGMLVVYCLRNTDLAGPDHGLAELIAVTAVVLLHRWKRSNLISILGGTILYMFLVQVVFITS